MKVKEHREMERTFLIFMAFFAILFLVFVGLWVDNVEKLKSCQEEKEIEWQEFEAQEAPLIGEEELIVFGNESLSFILRGTKPDWTEFEINGEICYPVTCKCHLENPSCALMCFKCEVKE